METTGIKETQEATIGALALGFYLAKLAKDGLDVADVAAFIDKLKTDDVFVAKLKAAIEGADQVPAELKDLSVTEALQFAMAIVPAAIAEIGALQTA